MKGTPHIFHDILGLCHEFLEVVNLCIESRLQHVLLKLRYLLHR